MPERKFIILRLCCLLLVLYICVTSAQGEGLLKTCYELSPILNSGLTEAEKSRIIVVKDKTIEDLEYRTVEYSYRGIGDVSFTLVWDHGVFSVQGSDEFITAVHACESADVGLEKAEATARIWFDGYLEESVSDPSYQAYIHHFDLKKITSSDCLFKPSFSGEQEDAEWTFQVYPVQANDEIKASAHYEGIDLAFQWAMIVVDATTGEVIHSETDGCFTQWKDIYNEELAADLQKILKTDTDDFSMYTFQDASYVKEMQTLTQAIEIIASNEPIELLCPGHTQEEIVFRLLARHCLLYWHAYNRLPFPSTLMVLQWYPDAMNYGRMHEPEVLDKIIDLYQN